MLFQETYHTPPKVHASVEGARIAIPCCVAVSITSYSMYKLSIHFLTSAAEPWRQKAQQLGTESLGEGPVTCQFRTPYVYLNLPSQNGYSLPFCLGSPHTDAVQPAFFYQPLSDTLRTSEASGAGPVPVFSSPLPSEVGRKIALSLTVLSMRGLQGFTDPHWHNSSRSLLCTEHGEVQVARSLIHTIPAAPCLKIVTSHVQTAKKKALTNLLAMSSLLP